MFYITVTTSNALYSLSAMAAGMVFISGFFFLLNADFLGVIQLIVYSGAVMALYAFGMMFFDSNKVINEKIKNPKNFITLSMGSAVLMVFIMAAPIIGEKQTAYPNIQSAGNVENIGYILFTKYLIPFELAAIMLLVAMIVGIVLASKKFDLIAKKEI